MTGLRSRLGGKPPPVLWRCASRLRIASDAECGPGRRQPRGPSSDMGGTGVIDQFLGVFTQYIDSGFGLRAGRRALARQRADRNRHHAGRPLLGAGARRGRARAADQEDPLYRRLRLHHRQLQQSRQDHLQLLRRPRHRGRRRNVQRRPAPSARPLAQVGIDAGQPILDLHLQPHGLRQLLRQLHPDRRSC